MFNLRPTIRYSGLYENKTVVHFVGGKLTQDLLDNLDGIADWVLDNDITILWGDDYQEKANADHPVAALIRRVKERAKERGVKPNTPIRILQIGNAHYNQLRRAYGEEKILTDRFQEDEELGGSEIKAYKENNGLPTTKLVKVVDDNGQLLGYYDDSVKDEVTIYTAQQQDRQKLYYYGNANNYEYEDNYRASKQKEKDGLKGQKHYTNNTSGLFVLPGGPGCGYEIINAFLYAMGSGDLPAHFRINVIDNEDRSYKDFIDAYLKLTGNNPACKKFLLKGYYKSAKEFVSANLFDYNDGLGV